MNLEGLKVNKAKGGLLVAVQDNKIYVFLSTSLWFEPGSDGVLFCMADFKKGNPSGFEWIDKNVTGGARNVEFVEPMKIKLNEDNVIISCKAYSSAEAKLFKIQRESFLRDLIKIITEYILSHPRVWCGSKPSVTKYFGLQMDSMIGNFSVQVVVEIKTSLPVKVWSNKYQEEVFRQNREFIIRKIYVCDDNQRNPQYMLDDEHKTVKFFNNEMFIYECPFGISPIEFGLVFGIDLSLEIHRNQTIHRPFKYSGFKQLEE